MSGLAEALAEHRIGAVRDESDGFACVCTAEWMNGLAYTAHLADVAHRWYAERLGALADDFESNVDWSSGRWDYGDNEAWQSAATALRAALTERGDRG